MHKRDKIVAPTLNLKYLELTLDRSRN